MTLTWKNHHYELIRTEDGSPSLVANIQDKVECMHHRGGAWAETKLIYQTPAKKVMQAGGRKFLSIGLGLAYNEMMLAKLALDLKVKLDKIESYEANPFLIESFQNYILAKKFKADGNEIQKTYQQIASLIEVQQSDLSEFYQKHIFEFKESLTLDSIPKENFDCVLFDAFSSKSSPELWSEDFLIQFLENLGSDCVLTTYASTGALKRALRKSGFQLLPRQGFQGRRESTLAVKGEKYLHALVTKN